MSSAAYDDRVIVVDAQGRIGLFEDAPVAAAHSMDTDWYAVDANGRVAYLGSGEEGAIPWIAHRQYWSELYADLVIARIASSAPGEPWSERAALARALDAATDPVERALVTSILGGDDPSREVYVDWLEANGKGVDGFPRERVVFRVDGDLRRIDVDALPEQWDGVLRFTTPEYLEMFREETWRYGGPWRALDARLGMTDAAAITELYRYGFTDFWEAGAIATVYVIAGEPEPRELGLYEYACSFSGAYSRRAVPDRPLLVEHLPAELQAALAQLRIPRTFESLERLDPETFADCQRYRD